MDQLKTRMYFLEQGQSISKLKALLDNSAIFGFFKRGLSILIEILLYLFFMLMLIVTIYIPTNPLEWDLNVSDRTQIHTELHNDDLAAMMIGFKLLLFICSLMPLVLAILLGRNRRKGAVISEAYEEIDKMKQKFDTALKDLSL